MPPAECLCIVAIPKLASSAEPSSHSMGINLYGHIMQMSLGTGLKNIGQGFPLARNSGSSETGTIWNRRDGQTGYFLNMEVFAMLLVIFKHR